MSDAALPFAARPTPALRAQNAGAAVVLAAARMGYKAHLVARAANIVRIEVLAGGKSAARAISDMKRDLALAARKTGGVA